MARQQVVHIRLVAHDVLNRRVVHRRVQLDFQPLRIVRHLRLPMPVEPFVQPDAVGVDGGEKRQIVIGNTEPVEHVRRHIQHDFHSLFMREVDQFLELRLDFRFRLVDRQQACEDALESMACGHVNVLFVLVQRGVLRINRNTESSHRLTPRPSSGWRATRTATKSKTRFPG